MEKTKIMEVGKMEYIRVSKQDGTERKVTLEEIIDKTENSGYWKPGTVEEMLKDGLDVQTPFAIYKVREN